MDAVARGLASKALGSAAQVAADAANVATYGFAPQAASLAVYKRFDTAPTQYRAAIIDRCIRRLKTDPQGVGRTLWDRLDVLVLIGAEQNGSLQDWKGRAGLTAAGTLTFTADTNIAGNGSTGYVDTDVAMNAAGLNFQQNSASLFMGSDTPAVRSTLDCGTDNVAMCGRFTSDLFAVRLNATSSATVARTSGQGLFAASRNDASNVTLYIDGTPAAAPVASASAAPDANTFRFCGRNITGTDTFSTTATWCVAFGAGFTDLEVRAISFALQEYRWNLALLAADQTGLLHILMYGQSLSVGAQTTAAVSTTALPGAKRFVGGIIPTSGGLSGGAEFASLLSLVESGGLETGGYAAVEMVSQLLASENGVNLNASRRTILMSTAGLGGQSAFNLSPTQTQFDTVVVDHITNGYARRTAVANSAYQLGLMTWRQGEADNNNGTAGRTYKEQVRNIRATAQAQAKTTTSINRQMPMVMYQVATHLFYSKTDPIIAKAQLELANEPGYALSCPMYQFAYAADHLHGVESGATYREIGAHEGLQAKRWLFDGVAPKWLQPASYASDCAASELPTRSGTTVTIPFRVPAGPLVFDTTQVAAQPNQGFALVDSAGSALTISSVAISGNSVVITAAAAVPAGAKVRYAWTGDAYKGMGNLRDSQGASIVFEPAGLNYPLHNWCPIFEVTVAN